MTVRELLNNGIISLDSELYIEVEEEIDGHDYIQHFPIMNIVKTDDEKIVGLTSYFLNDYISEFIMWEAVI